MPAACALPRGRAPLPAAAQPSACNLHAPPPPPQAADVARKLTASRGARAGEALQGSASPGDRVVTREGGWGALL